MKREEAIKRLKEYAQYAYGIWHDDEEDTKAFDMAIEALSESNVHNLHSGDLISRADAIEAVWKLDKEATEYVMDDTHEIHGYCTAIGVCVGELSSLPSAEAETVDCTDFIRWLTETVMDDGMWELNAVAYGEVIARKLTKLGVLEVKDDVYVYDPSAEAVQGWIPCSERLPKEDEYVGNVCKYYLIQDEYGDMHVAHLSSRGWETIESVKTLGCDVLAWMPLPTPYKGGDDK